MTEISFNIESNFFMPLLTHQKNIPHTNFTIPCGTFSTYYANFTGNIYFPMIFFMQFLFWLFHMQSQLIQKFKLKNWITRKIFYKNPKTRFIMFEKNYTYTMGNKYHAVFCKYFLIFHSLVCCFITALVAESRKRQVLELRNLNYCQKLPNIFLMLFRITNVDRM